MSQIGSSPQGRGENKKCLKPPPSHVMMFKILYSLLLGTHPEKCTSIPNDEFRFRRFFEFLDGVSEPRRHSSSRGDVFPPGIEEMSFALVNVKGCVCANVWAKNEHVFIYIYMAIYI